MKRGEVWWVDFDPSVGSEIRKTRPGVIIRNDAANRNLSRVVVIPRTSNTSKLYPGESILNVAGKSGKAMADQTMTADKKRLKTLITTLSNDDMRSLEDAIMIHLGMRR